MRTFFKTSAVAATLLLSMHVSAIADSYRDLSFNSPHGLRGVAFDIGPALTDSVTDVLVQPDGKIVMVGLATSGEPGGGAGAVMRLNSDGTCDADFGSAYDETLCRGETKFQVEDGHNTYIRSAALQADGRIVVAGQWVNGTGGAGGFVARLTTTGDMDASFSPTGIRLIGLSDINDIVVDPANGRILLAGFSRFAVSVSSADDMAIVALKSNGDFDTTFCSGCFLPAFAFFDFKPSGQMVGSNDRATALMLQDGKIVVAGPGAQLVNESTRNFVVARVNPDGSLDTGFGSSGSRVVEFDWCPAGPNPANTIVTAMAAGPGGRIVVGGRGFNALCPQGTAALAVLDSNGRLDSAFSSDGKHTERYFSTGFSREFLNDLVVDAAGRIWLIGTGQIDDRTYMSVGRLLPDGGRDSSFGSNGVVHYGRGRGGADAIALQGELPIVTGYRYWEASSTDTDFLAIRLCDDCGDRIFNDGFEIQPF